MAVLVSLAAPASALGDTPPPAAALLSVAAVIPPADPVQVPTTASGQAVRVEFVISASQPVSGVTIEGNGDGLAVANSLQYVAELSGSMTVGFDVSGTTPGFHALTVTASAASAGSASTVAPYIWTTGSPLLTGTNPIYRHTYAWEGTEQLPGRPGPTRVVRMLSTVGGGQAFVGLPAHGVPACTPPAIGCEPYAYDAGHRLLQVGTGIIGALSFNADSTADVAYLDGFVPPDPAQGEVYGRASFAAPVGLATRRTILKGTFRYACQVGLAGITFEKLSLLAERRYRLKIAYDGGPFRRFAGRYRIGHHGAITFLARHRVVELGTLAVEPTTDRRRASGFWLVLSGPRGRHPDGNLLERVT